MSVTYVVREARLWLVWNENITKIWYIIGFILFGFWIYIQFLNHPVLFKVLQKYSFNICEIFFYVNLKPDVLTKSPKTIAAKLLVILHSRN